MNWKPVLVAIFAVATTGCAGMGILPRVEQATPRVQEAKATGTMPGKSYIEKQQMELRSRLAGLDGTSFKQHQNCLIITLGCDVLFDKDSARIRPAACGLDALAETLKTYSETQINVDAHTDCMRSEEENLVLSESRAGAVRHALVAKGVDASRIKARGWGEAKPAASNATAEGRQANRRVSITLLPLQSSSRPNRDAVMAFLFEQPRRTGLSQSPPPR
jgi:outer membrane protein OmpA-like peptidoglycan-associated protein